MELGERHSKQRDLWVQSRGLETEEKTEAARATEKWGNHLVITVHARAACEIGHPNRNNSVLFPLKSRANSKYYKKGQFEDCREKRRIKSGSMIRMGLFQFPSDSSFLSTSVL